jgi:peptidoglycan/xylan/chitin deacetylase (PgdA/CDA1 family)
LTFDDGPTPDSTERVLEVLDRHGVHATFFCIGRNAAAAPALLRAVADAGHLIANHSFDHPRDSCFHGRRYWSAQVERTNDTIASITGNLPRLFRSPMGLKTPRILWGARQHQMTTGTWTHRGLDAISKDPARIVARLTRGVQAGAVLVLHDGAEPGRRRSPDATLKALPEVIARLSDRGLGFVRLDELLGLAGYAETQSSATA